ncbi:MAG: hypothetical protein ACRC8Y_22385, partial [Chroococcales cyanobacterium]
MFVSSVQDSVRVRVKWRDKQTVKTGPAIADKPFDSIGLPYFIIACIESEYRIVKQGPIDSPFKNPANPHPKRILSPSPLQISPDSKCYHFPTFCPSPGHHPTGLRC